MAPLRPLPDQQEHTPGAWETHGHGGPGAPGGALPSRIDVRLTLADGVRIDLLAEIAEDHIRIEGVPADPGLPAGGLATLADWFARGAEERCAAGDDDGWDGGEEPAGPSSAHGCTCCAQRPEVRGRRPVPARGSAGRRAAAEVYRQAQRDGLDPVLAVMGATGRSRRKSLRLIAGARDEGYLPPRHNRR